MINDHLSKQPLALELLNPKIGDPTSEICIEVLDDLVHG